jgi:outer membrane protein TolC
MLILFLFIQVDSMSMDQALARGLKLSPAYQQSGVTLDKARIAFFQSLFNLTPTVSAGISYSKTDYPDSLIASTERYSNSLNFSMPIFDLDVLGSIFVSGLNWKGNRIQHRSDQANLILQIKSAYYNLVNARELLTYSDIAIQRSDENLTLIKTKYELGAASRLDMLQAEVLYLQTRQVKARTKTMEITAQEQLKSLLGEDRDIYPTDSLTVPGEIPFPPLDSLLEQLDRVNYNLRLAGEMEKAAKINLLVAYLGFLPRISGSYGLGAASESLHTDPGWFFDNANRTWSISVSFPIFEVKGLVFKLLNARKDYQLKKLSRRQTILDTEKALRTTYYGLQESYENLRLSQRSYEAATEAANIAREQYRLGAMSLIDWLKVEGDMYDSKTAYSQALSDYYVKQLNFSFILGETSFNKEP